MSKSVSNFLLKRRSVTAKTMLASDVTNEDLDIIISSGLRVPDHGALSPWKIIIFKGESRKTFGKLFLGKRFKELNPNASKDDIIYDWYSIKKTAQVISETQSQEESLSYIEEKFEKINKPNIKILFDFANIHKNFDNVTPSETTLLSTLLRKITPLH